MRLGSADGNKALRLGAAALAVGLGALSWGMYAAGPASAALGRATLGLSPSSGPADTVFGATFHISGSANCAGQVTFSFDGQPVGSAGLDGGCSASTSIQVPLGSAAGAHHVRAVASTGATAGATFTVSDGGSTGGPPPPTQPTSSQAPPPNQQSSNSFDTTSQMVSYYNNYTTPTTPWTAPAFAPQPIPGVTPGPCDTTGPHATAPNKSFLSIPSYSVGTHADSALNASVSEPGSGALPILGISPSSMLPPQLGVAPYQSLEILETIDPNVSPKLRLAAAAGEPFPCLQVETFGAPGSGFGYLVYALKGALVISVQDANADGSPFVVSLPTVASVPTPAASPSSSKPGAKKTPAAPPSTTPSSTAPKAKYEVLKLGYTSIQWEYQDAGGANAPAHRGTGTITPPPPRAQLSYANLVFAFGGLVAATVALMFAYHSRRRDLDRRARRRAARHV